MNLAAEDPAPVTRKAEWGLSPAAQTCITAGCVCRARGVGSAGSASQNSRPGRGRGQPLLAQQGSPFSQTSSG